MPSRALPPILALLIGVVLAAGPAQAWWVLPVPPPAYYYPPYAYPYPPPYAPGWYPAPPAAYAPPAQTPMGPGQAEGRDQSTSVPDGRTCYAGVYVCAAPGHTPAGSGCTCPALGAPSYGVVE